MHTTVLRRAGLSLTLAASSLTLCACGGDPNEQEYRFEGATIVHLQDSINEIDAAWQPGAEQADPDLPGGARCFFQAEEDPDTERREIHPQLWCGPLTSADGQTVWESGWLETGLAGEGGAYYVYTESFRTEEGQPEIQPGFELWRPDGEKPEGL